jgi:adenylate cyclase
MTYTAVGAMVNLAARLEGLNKFYGTRILVSEATRRGAGSNFVFRPVDLVLPKGAQEPIEIHELVGLAAGVRGPEGTADARLAADPAILAGLPHWRTMVRCFRARQFEAAEEALRASAAAASSSAAVAAADPLAAVYDARLAALRAEPPPADWTPVIRFERK